MVPIGTLHIMILGFIRYFCLFMLIALVCFFIFIYVLCLNFKLWWLSIAVSAKPIYGFNCYGLIASSMLLIVSVEGKCVTPVKCERYGFIIQFIFTRKYIVLDPRWSVKIWWTKFSNTKAG